MPTANDIMQAIADHLGLNADDVDKHALLREDLNLGPIELNDLLHDLSQKFKVNFEPGEIEDLKKVEDLVVMIEDNLLD